MDYILALFFPCIVLFFKGRPGTAVILFILQITIVGWIPATVIAFFVINDENHKKNLKSP